MGENMKNKNIILNELIDLPIVIIWLTDQNRILQHMVFFNLFNFIEGDNYGKRLLF